MKDLYDVIVIGGGPVGSYTARRLCKKGFKVCVFEQKQKIGEGVICTGVISTNSFERFNLPTDSILTEIKSFTFISPENQRLEYIAPKPFAYVVDRELFDYQLSEIAKKDGVQFNLGVNVSAIEEDIKYYKINANGIRCFGKFIIIATGVNYQLQKKIGLGIPPQFLYGSQIELPKKVEPHNIEIYISQKYVPDSFAWVVPINEKKARIGMILEKKGKFFLKRFLKNRMNFGDNILNQNGIFIKPIAHGPIKNSVSGRILAVGEAAGQVKTTTGGGIFTGLFCAEIAVDYLFKALKYGKSLDEYDITWRSALSSELDIGKKVRKVATKISDRTIEQLFTFVKRNRFWVDLLIPKINFDFHSDLFYFCLKSFSDLLKIT
ncbi:MAG: NAD(P)/FAD-dependent oxidoreductase [candidate division WOR-3 bacterium]